MPPIPSEWSEAGSLDGLAEDSGLTSAEAQLRLQRIGPNALPEPRPASILAVFLKQFLSPLIYILLAAAGMSLALGDLKAGIFIGVVLLANGLIGTAQEYSANRAAAALRKLEQPHATVIRDGLAREIDARDLVPGDLVRLDAGQRVPADLELIRTSDLQTDESLLTGESRPIHKRVAASAGPEAERIGFAFAGSVVTRGRGDGRVIETGPRTRLGKIASALGQDSTTKAPLLLRMERFSRAIAVAVGVAIALLLVAGLLRGMGFAELILLSVGLAVSAIPEGLPVAISIALAISMRRMAKSQVIVRNMTAVEALGSCTLIATDKTGTLTLNELTVTDILLPDGTRLVCEAGVDLDACTIIGPDGSEEDGRARAAALLRAAALPNEADLVQDSDGWRGRGDTVDVALLSAARKGGLLHSDMRAEHPLLSRIPYEPDLRYAASLHQADGHVDIFVKGAPETLIEMCDRMDRGGIAAPIDRVALLRQKDELAARGLRVLAFAAGELSTSHSGVLKHGHLVKLNFLGLAGMQDPVRPEVPAAIRDCRRAGIEVAMITGDDAGTALAIAADAGLAMGPDQVATGEDIRRAEVLGEAALDLLTAKARLYARVEPEQKLAIVSSLARGGHFVAVTGDGVNDAPALRHAHVGVAMGRRGTEVAKESADIVLTDDNFASIVKGIREGRVAYANIRKLVFMLVSTGAAEVLLFLLAIPLGLPMPLLPLQLLWLNLVTNGIQDVALATENAEGDELSFPSRRPKEPILDTMMIRRIVISTLVIGGGSFAVYWVLLQQGWAVEAARNVVLLLFVLFENFQTLNSRSERHSALRLPLFGNLFLVFAILGSQGLQIAAMYIPWLSDTLALKPVSPMEWLVLLGIAASVVLVVEIDKWFGRRRARSTT